MMCELPACRLPCGKACLTDTAVLVFAMLSLAI